MTDRIEREIRIDAPIERVFALVSEPGWWIEDGPERTVTREGDVTVVELPRHGRFPVVTVSADAPHHLAFRGGGPGQTAEEGTLVEFHLTEDGGGTLLRVVESGFGAGADIAGDEQGWEHELAAARGRAEAG
ncbi:SRPBCC domain-containing protein [Pseudonocardia oceani]|uniref:SRPBCC domain-containing protein n=1 Tax=Pseudonocardia oceani TaxID=2792013 RepID=UPI001C49EE77|nr:SRPBCC domain-containing protein [Pseudonocardia oceani]